jgi:hypothetical protein
MKPKTQRKKQSKNGFLRCGEPKYYFIGKITSGMRFLTKNATQIMKRDKKFDKKCKMGHPRRSHSGWTENRPGTRLVKNTLIGFTFFRFSLSNRAAARDFMTRVIALDMSY